MDVVEDQIQSSSCPPPSMESMLTEEELVPKQSPCLEMVATSNVKKSNPMPGRPKLKRKKATIESLYDSPQDQSSALERANEVEARLDPNFPFMHKVMVPSAVTGGYCLNIPRKFMPYLPKEDTMMVLEDENGTEFKSKYLVDKGGLSGGWRGFAITQKLMQGDIVIFHLVAATRFKVYIIRSNGLGLMRIEAGSNQMDHDYAIVPYQGKQVDDVKPIPEDNQIDNDAKSCPIPEKSANDEEEPMFEFMDGLAHSGSALIFEQVKCIEQFSVHVNGIILNSELSRYNMRKYYELCKSQNGFLHEHLLEGLNCKLIAGVISETINIADAIRECKMSTPREYFSTWAKTLKAFANLGMNVGFMLTRMDQLASLSSKEKGLKRARLEEDQGAVDVSSSEAKDAMDNLDSEMETMDVSSEKLEVMFQELAKAPW